MSWNISGSVNACRTCEKKFSDKENYFSHIFERGDALERRDYCNECWETVEKKEEGYYWRSVVCAEMKKNIFVDNETLMNFFTRLEEEDTEIKKNFRYLLSLILMRKRMLKFKDVFKEGENEYMVLSDRKDNEYRVLNPKMDTETLANVKEQVISVLHENFFTEEE